MLASRNLQISFSQAPEELNFRGVSIYQNLVPQETLRLTLRRYPACRKNPESGAFWPDSFTVIKPSKYADALMLFPAGFMPKDLEQDLGDDFNALAQDLNTAKPSFTINLPVTFVRAARDHQSNKHPYNLAVIGMGDYISVMPLEDHRRIVESTLAGLHSFTQGF